MMQTEAAPKQREKFSFFYHLAMGFSIFLFHTLFPVRYHNAPLASDVDAPYLLISNHDSMLDPLLIGWKLKRYQIRYLGKKELVSNRVIAAMYRNLTMIPVDRHNMDMHAVRACLKALKDGHVLGIFPEGTRHKTTLMEEMESGIGMIALRANVPLLPAYIAQKPRLFRRVDCYYGEPFTIADLAEGGINKEACEKVLERITKIYREMAQKHEENIRS